jgi:hypothetical protein
MMALEKLEDCIRVLSEECLPNGVRCITVVCNDHECLLALPRFVKFDGNVYGRSGWNSDDKIAYYRTDIQRAIRI